MIDIASYRQRIGCFSQKINNKKFLKYSYFHAGTNKTMFNARHFSISRIFWIRVVLILYTLGSINSGCKYSNIYENCHTQSQSKKSVIVNPYIIQTEDFNWIFWSGLTGNFFARYLNGNGRNKGVPSKYKKNTE